MPRLRFDEDERPATDRALGQRSADNDDDNDDDDDGGSMATGRGEFGSDAIVAGSFPELIRQAKRGDDRAIELIYLNHVAIVHGYMVSCGVRDADDLTSDVFVGMLRNLKRFNGGQPEFRRWLMTIAYRRVVDHRRRTGRTRVDLAEPSTLIDNEGRGQATELRSVVVDPELALAFQELTPAQREVLALRFVADVSLQGVAEVTGKPIGAVKSIQNRGLNALRRAVPDILRRKEA